jgi:NADPH:quinone reductase-like Zn-dependent oxidoreductase
VILFRLYVSQVMPEVCMSAKRNVLLTGYCLLVALLQGQVVLAAPATMQAVVANHGDIVLKTVTVPNPGAGEVLIKVQAVGVNPIDWKTVDRRAAQGEFIPGYDASGVVEAVGPAVSDVKVGDAVMGWTRNLGTYAEYAVVPADTAIRKAENVSFVAAAAMPHAGFTAWNLVVDVAKVKAGQKVLVLGGSGGVGSFAVQIAKNRGAYVLATASTRNQGYLKSLGVDQPIDYTQQAFEQQLKDVDVVINTVDTDNADKAVKVLKQGGVLVSVGGLPAADVCARAQIRCENRGFTGTTAHDAMRQMMQWAGEGKFKVNIDQTFSGLNATNKAWQYSMQGHTRGKSVVSIGAQ